MGWGGAHNPRALPDMQGRQRWPGGGWCKPHSTALKGRSRVSRARGPGRADRQGCAVSKRGGRAKLSLQPVDASASQKTAISCRPRLLPPFGCHTPRHVMPVPHGPPPAVSCWCRLPRCCCLLAPAVAEALVPFWPAAAAAAEYAAYAAPAALLLEAISSSRCWGSWWCEGSAADSGSMAALPMRMVVGELMQQPLLRRACQLGGAAVRGWGAAVRSRRVACMHARMHAHMN